MPEEINSIYVPEGEDKDRIADFPIEGPIEEGKPSSNRDNAQEIANVEKMQGRDAALARESALDREAKDGLTDEEREMVVVMDGLQKKYPDAFDVIIGGDGSKALYLPRLTKAGNIDTVPNNARLYPTLITKRGVLIPELMKTLPPTINLNELERYMNLPEYNKSGNAMKLPVSLFNGTKFDPTHVVACQRLPLDDEGVQLGLKQRFKAVQTERVKIKAEELARVEKNTADKILEGL